ncbi:MAG TPA: hypothetical protein GYA06_09860 [Chloroflexi bacterium]|jgi:WD40 repeat protein|nr:hypothetical protein [Chloroflexota bacterium]
MNRRLTFLLMIPLVLLAACQPAPAAPLPTDTLPAPTITTAATEPAAGPEPDLTPTEPPAASPEPDRVDAPPGLALTGSLPLEYPSRLAWSADGTEFAVLHGGGVTVYDAASLNELAAHAPEDPGTVYDLSGARLIALVRDDQIHLVDVTTGETRQTIIPAVPMVPQAELSEDGALLATLSGDYPLGADLWDTATGEHLAALSGFETASPVAQASLPPGGRWLVWTARATLQLQDLESGELGPAFHHEDFISAWDLSRDGAWLVTAAVGTVSAGEFLPTLFLWDPASGEARSQIEIQEAITAAALSPDGRWLAAGHPDGVSLWDTDSLEQLDRAETAGMVSALAFSPDGKTLLAAGESGLLVFMLSSGE